MQCLKFALVVIAVGSIKLTNPGCFVLNEDSEIKSLQRPLITLSVDDCSQMQTQYFRVVWEVSQILWIEVYLCKVCTHTVPVL